MIKIHLSKILGERRIKQITIAKKTGIRTATIGAYYHERAQIFRKQDLDKICRALNVPLEKLLEYDPEEENWEDRIEFACTCGEVFPVEVWHCPVCNHHWQINKTICCNCDFEKKNI